VREADDQAILDAKAQVGAGGFGCEPASAESVAGAKLLRDEGVIAPSDRVVCIITGHELKDPNATIAYHSATPGHIDASLTQHSVTSAAFANQPNLVENNIDRIMDVLRKIRQP
jgi:threonine synthase